MSVKINFKDKERDTERDKSIDIKRGGECQTNLMSHSAAVFTVLFGILMQQNLM